MQEMSSNTDYVEDECEVEQIVDMKTNCKIKSMLFRVRWLGYSEADDSWLPFENLNCELLINDFLVLSGRKQEYEKAIAAKNKIRRNNCKKKATNSDTGIGLKFLNKEKACKRSWSKNGANDALELNGTKKLKQEYTFEKDKEQSCNGTGKHASSVSSQTPISQSSVLLTVAEQTRNYISDVTQHPPNQMPPQLERDILSSIYKIEESSNVGDMRLDVQESVTEEIEAQPKIKKETSENKVVHLAKGEHSTTMEENSDQVRERIDKGCDCENDNCFRGMNHEFVFRHRSNIAELTKKEHEFYLMGVTMACLANPHETFRRQERKRQRTSYVFQGKKVCLSAFMYLQNSTLHQLKTIRKHVMANGVTERVHGNYGRKPPNKLSIATYQQAAAFLSSYIARYSDEQQSSSLVLRQHLGSKKTYIKYSEFCESMHPEVKIMGHSSFRLLIKDHFSDMKFLRMDKQSEIIDNENCDKGNFDAPSSQNMKYNLNHGLDYLNQSPAVEHEDLNNLQQPPYRLQEMQMELGNTNYINTYTPPQDRSDLAGPFSIPHVDINGTFCDYSDIQVLQPQNLLYSPLLQPDVFPSEPQQPLYPASIQPLEFLPGETDLTHISPSEFATYIKL